MLVAGFPVGLPVVVPVDVVLVGGATTSVEPDAWALVARFVTVTL